VEDTQQTNKPEENAETPVDSVLQAEPVQAEETTPQATVVVEASSPPANEQAKPTIYTISARLFAEEYEYLMEVLKSRQSHVDSEGQPLSRDKSHLLKQCIRFTLNFNPKNRFWIDPAINQTRINT
jgi:hypothetical protein